MTKWTYSSVILYILFGFFSCQEKVENEQAQKTETIREIIRSEGNFMIPTLPDQMTLCGDTIDLTDLDIRERLDYEVTANAYYHSSTLLYLKRAHRYFPMIESLLKENGIPDDLKYLAVIESGLSQATSPSGAKGFWQFMEGTAKEYDLEVNRFVDERLDIKKSTVAACLYLKDALKDFGDWPTTIASYNRGRGGMNKDLEWQYQDSYFDVELNRETGRYVYRLLALKLIMEHPENYGFDLKLVELYNPIETQTVKITDGIEDIAKWSVEKGLNYKIIKRLNPWILKNKLPAKETFVIEIPGDNVKMGQFKN